MLGGALACGLLAACGRSDHPAHPLEGSALPRVALRDLNGAGRTLGLATGQPLLLNLWATWCPPCRAEMPDLDLLARSPAGIRVLGVAVDDDLNLVREFVLQYRIGFDIWSDPGLRACREALAVAGIPATYLVAGDGRIRRVVSGEQRWNDSPARDWVEALRGPDRS
ncbi:MAG: TlpA family protein disulfide reductase [Betaproteobacteria bacterium]|nr:TlpA family protein disulfide reductase [Betaproteobacteria bacterium]MBK8917799.1 TlpA family protein disulfide reductase [Betaproteobacteria bacterium]